MDIDPRSGAAVLDPETCWELLASSEVGRLAVSVARHPDIFPINYVVDKASIVFCTGEGTKLAAIATCPFVTFETDAYDTATGQAWSVVVKGHAAEMAQVFDLPDAEVSAVAPWQAGPKSRFVRIVAEEISGRRFRAVRTPPQSSP